MDRRFSFFRVPVASVVPYKDITLVDVYRYIVGPYAKERTDEHQQLLHKVSVTLCSSPEGAEMKKVCATYKRTRFDYVCFSGTFTRRIDANMVAHSGYLCLDFDHLEGLVNDGSTLRSQPHMLSPMGRTLEGQTPTCSLPSESMAQVAQVAQRLVEDWSQLPDFLQRVVAVDENEDVKSLLLFGSLVTLSAVMPGVSGIYGGKRVYPNLFGFVVAPPASSKGKLADVVSLVKPIEDEIEMQNALGKARYEEEMAAYKAGHAEGTPQPKQPAAKMLVIAANASSTALYQALNDSGGTGLTFETEGDTVSMTLKTDFGNYSDGLRKAFHHEEIAYIRRKENERTRIRRPRWSVLLAGTPAQVTTFIPNSENGLFSRFLFYSLPRTYEWQDMFAGGDLPLDEHFEALGEEYLALYHRLQQCPVTFVLTPEQQVRFNAHFAEVQREYAELYGDDLIASVRRLGLICYRLAMMLTVVRLLNQDYTLGAEPGSEKLHSVSVTLCSSDGDFEMAMTLVDRLLQHTAAVYSNLLTPVEGAAVPEMPGQIRQFLQALPEDFTTEEFVAIGEKMGIPRRTAQRYVGKLTSVYKLLECPAVGRYRKEKRELRNEKQERRSER